MVRIWDRIAHAVPMCLLGPCIPECSWPHASSPGAMIINIKAAVLACEDARARTRALPQRCGCSLGASPDLPGIERVAHETWAVVPEDLAPLAKESDEGVQNGPSMGVGGAAPLQGSKHHQPAPGVRPRQQLRAGEEDVVLQPR